MFKKLTLLILMVFCLNDYAQVVIKDEIDLDKEKFELQEPESAGLTMPFYGKVKETLFSSYNLTCSKSRNELIVANTYYQFGPCWTWNCGPTGSCFCSSNISQLIENIPMGTLIDIKIQKCSNWDGGTNYYWKVLEHYFELYSSTNDYKQYKIYSRYDENSQWINVGFMEFSKTTPPGNCPNAGGNYCDSFGWVEVPNVELVPYPGDASTYINFRCGEEEDRYAFFSRYPSNPTNLYSLTSSDVIACYNQIGQTWQFNLNQDMKLYYVAALCKDKIDNMKIIYSLESVDSIDLDDCRLALRSFNGHKRYPYNIEDGGFIIKEALLLHEDGHKEKFEEFMNNYFFLWETEIEIFRRVCTTYIDIFEARKGGLDMYQKAFEKYYKAFTDAHDKFLGPKGSSRRRHEEERVNNRPEMTELINLYIKKLKDHCHIQ